jgi:hypothetical protein
VLGPPEKIAPDALFRRLIRTPRPEAPLPFRFRNLEHEPLSVVALTSTELAEADSLEGDAAGLWLIAHSLRAGGHLLFDDPEVLLDLPHTETDALLAAVNVAFHGICPRYGRSDWFAWRDKLRIGAQHASNETVATMLGDSYDAVTVGKFNRVLDRPDRFFGVAPVELTDGQLMAFRVARELHEERYK